MVRAADIGVEFQSDETGCFQVTQLLPGPALSSGQIDVGDIFYEIDGVKVLYGIGPNGRPLPDIEVREMLRGLEGSVINLRVQKGRLGRIVHVSLVRSAPVENSPKRAGNEILPLASNQLERSAPQHAETGNLNRDRIPVSRERAAPPPPPPPPPGPPPPDNNYRGPQTPVDRAPQMAQPISITRTLPIQKGQGLGHWVLMGAPRAMPAPPVNEPPLRAPRPPVRQQILIPKERPLPEDKANDKNYWKHYKPKIPDRFGLGIVFKPYGEGRLTIDSLLEDGPAKLSLQDIRPKDWLHEIDRQVVFGKPTKFILDILEAKKIGQPVYLGLHRVAPDMPGEHIEVKIIKGETGLRCGTGIVFKSDSGVPRWVRIAQVVPGGAAEKAVAPLKASEVLHVNDRVLEVDGVDVSCQPFRAWRDRLLGEYGAHILMTFADAKGVRYKVNMYRDYIDQSKVDPACLDVPPPETELPVRPVPYLPPRILAHGPDFLPLAPLLAPASNPALWKSFIDHGVPDPDAPLDFFNWNGCRLTQPEYTADRVLCRVYRVVQGLQELIYWGPGCNEQVEINISPPTPEKTTAPVKPAAAAVDPKSAASSATKATAASSASDPSPPKAPSLKERAQAIERGAASTERGASLPAQPPAVKDPPVRQERERSAAPPAAPTAAPAPVASAVKSDNEDVDDESILVLPDGRQVEAKKVEQVLKKNLDAVAHVMVVGSKRKFLSCLLTIKTLGSEAVAKGQDPDSLPNQTDLAGPALALAQSVGTSITSVLQARSSAEFRTKGLLPCFAKANQEIGGLYHCQVKRFTILTTTFSAKTGELLPNGSLNRKVIKNRYKNTVIEGMYKEKESQ